jgi:hypothetical protein
MVTSLFFHYIVFWHWEISNGESKKGHARVHYFVVRGCTLGWLVACLDRQFTCPGRIPNGYYARNVVVASPGGHHLLAALEQGGTVCFQDFNPTTRQFDKAVLSAHIGLDSNNDSALEPDMKFGYEERNGWRRGIGNAIAFSPYYEADGTIFAASF